jgi:hypothetical protein
MLKKEPNQPRRDKEKPKEVKLNILKKLGMNF